MKILLTGSKGMLGKDLTVLLRQSHFEVIETNHSELDITNKDAVYNFINTNSLDFVINVAAYTNVDGAETEKELAFKVNENGSINLANATKDKNIPILSISTDYIFDGTSKKPYEPNDKPNPINIYGQSKLASEIAIKNNPKHYIIRTSWLYGKNGKNFVETIIKLGQNNPEIRVVDDQVGCPTSTVALSNAIIKIIKEHKPFGTYHICGSGCTSWYGFAKKIVELTHINTKVIPVKSKEFPSVAIRPMYSVMNSNNICPNWEVILEQYMKERN